MARIRTIKPEFWSSEQVMACNPLTRLLFIGLWNFCDDNGNHPDSEKTLKALIFPGDDINSTSVRRMLDELSTNALIRFYEVSGKRYINVPGWKHQRIDRPTIKHPDFTPETEVENEGMRPVAQLFDDDSTNCLRILDEPSTPEGKGREGKGINQKLSIKNVEANRIKKDWADAFSTFWKLYPNKVAKSKALQSWMKLTPGQDLLNQIINTLGRYCKSEQWTKDGGQFIPHPTTWLNQKRWEDEVPDHGHAGQRGADAPAGRRTTSGSLVDQVKERNRQREAGHVPEGHSEAGRPEGAIEGEFSAVGA